MRLFEVLVFLNLAIFVLTVFLPAGRKKHWFHLLPGVALVLILVHVLVEGVRWQMMPAYVFALAAFAATMRNIKRAGKTRERSGAGDVNWLRVTKGAIAALVLAVIALPPLLLPVFTLPAPSGPFPVGTRFDYFAAADRPASLLSDHIKPGDISVQIWYPAESALREKPMRYWQNAAGQSRIIAKFWDGLPPFIFSHFSLVKTHSIPEAPLAEKVLVFPVLIFNHGSIGLPSLHTALMEDLASHGYIVFSIGHADYIPFFILPDGRLHAFDPGSEEIRFKMRENEDLEVRKIFSRLTRSREPGEQKALFGQFLGKNPRNQESLRRWAGEISLAVDHLERMNSGGGPFSGRMNLNQLGVFGVSFGGAAAVQACIGDSRLKAAVNIDCPQFGDVLERGLHQPVMFIDSEQYGHKNDLFLERLEAWTCNILVHGTVHQNFSDMGFWGALFKMQMLGEIDATRCQQIQNSYLRAFFDRFLRGKDRRLVVGPCRDFPEVEIVFGAGNRAQDKKEKGKAWGHWGQVSILDSQDIFDSR